MRRWPCAMGGVWRVPITKSNIFSHPIYSTFCLRGSRFRIPGSRFRFRGFLPAIKVVTDRYKVPGSGSITQRGTPRGAEEVVGRSVRQ